MHDNNTTITNKIYNADILLRNRRFLAVFSVNIEPYQGRITYNGTADIFCQVIPQNEDSKLNLPIMADIFGQVNFFVGAFHDAVLLYGMALNETLEAGGDPKDGHTVAHAMWDRNFIGLSSICTIVEVFRVIMLRAQRVALPRRI